MNRRTVASALASISAAIMMLVAVSVLAPRTAVTTDNRFCLGTYCTITVYGSPSKAGKAIREAWDAVTDLENRISANLDYSEISKVNSGAGDGMWIAVSEDTWDLVEFALDVKAKTSGALDIGLGSLIDLWGIGTPRARVPQAYEIEDTLKGCDSDSILMTRDGSGFFMRIANKGTKINLGAIGKGHAADLAADVLRSHGIRSALLDFGGNIYAIGGRAAMLGSRDFKVGLQDPDGIRGESLKTVEIHDGSIATSGSYERFVLGPDGHAYSHILDPDTGWSAEGEVRSVSVAGPSSAICDALSTSLYILGPKEGGHVIESSFAGYRAFFLLSDGSVSEVGNMDVLR